MQTELEIIGEERQKISNFMIEAILEQMVSVGILTEESLV